MTRRRLFEKLRRTALPTLFDAKTATPLPYATPLSIKTRTKEDVTKDVPEDFK